LSVEVTALFQLTRRICKPLTADSEGL